LPTPASRAIGVRDTLPKMLLPTRLVFANTSRHLGARWHTNRFPVDRFDQARSGHQRYPFTPRARHHHNIYGILPAVTSAEVIRFLRRDGWVEDIPIGTLASIGRQAGIKLR
jgi:hypothetical protein